MTREENRTFLRYGAAFLNLAVGCFLVLQIGKGYGYLSSGSLVVPALVAACGLTGFLAFIFLGVLGIMPHVLRFDHDHVASDRERRTMEPLGFLILKD